MEFCPTDVGDGLAQLAILLQVLHLQRLDPDDVVVFDDLGRHLVQEVVALVGDLLVDARDLALLLLVVLRLGQLHLPVQGDELTAGQLALLAGEFLLERLEVAVVRVHRPVRQDCEVLQPDVDPDRGAGLGKRLDVLFDLQGDEVLARRVPADRGAEDTALDPSRVGEPDPLQLRQFEPVPGDRHLGLLRPALNVRRVRLGRVALRLEARVPVLFREETVVAVGQVLQRPLQGRAVHLFQPRELLLHGRQCLGARAVGQSGPARLVGLVPPREEMVEDEAGATERLDDQDLLFLGRIDPKSVSFMCRHAVHPL